MCVDGGSLRTVGRAVQQQRAAHWHVVCCCAQLCDHAGTGVGGCSCSLQGGRCLMKDTPRWKPTSHHNSCLKVHPSLNGDQFTGHQMGPGAAN